MAIAQPPPYRSVGKMDNSTNVLIYFKARVESYTAEYNIKNYSDSELNHRALILSVLLAFCFVMIPCIRCA